MSLSEVSKRSLSSLPALWKSANTTTASSSACSRHLSLAFERKVSPGVGVYKAEGAQDLKVPLSACVEDPSLNIRRPAYLDNQATTPLDPRVLDKMMPFMVSKFGNPHSRTHVYGWESEEAVETARKQLGSLLNAKRADKEIIFTSGATESNNLSIKGYVMHQLNQRQAKNDTKPVHIITTQIEHKCVLASCRDLEEAFPDRVKVTYLPVDTDGILSPESVAKAIIPGETVLVSVICVHNEIGVLQDIKAISQEVHKHRGILMHTDIAQAAGKVHIDVQDMGIDLASISGHKLYGPRGIGCLYINSAAKPRIRLVPLMSGGAQERGIRSGTVPHYLTIGLGEAAAIAEREMKNDTEWVKYLADKTYNRLTDALPGLVLNGHFDQRYPGNLNISFDCVEGESLLMALSKYCAISSGSACTSASLEPSYVLRAIGVGDDLAHTSLRFGFGRFTTEEEVEEVIQAVISSVIALRELSPLWEMKQNGISLESMEWT